MTNSPANNSAKKVRKNLKHKVARRKKNRLNWKKLKNKITRRILLKKKLKLKQVKKKFRSRSKNLKIKLVSRQSRYTLTKRVT